MNGNVMIRVLAEQDLEELFCPGRIEKLFMGVLPEEKISHGNQRMLRIRFDEPDQGVPSVLYVSSFHTPSC